MNKNTKIYIGIIVCLLIVAAVTIKNVYFKNQNSNSTSSNNQDSSNSNTIIPIESSSDISVPIDSDEDKDTYNNYDAKINLSTLTYEGDKVTISENTISISEEGTYYFYGSNDNAKIEVDAKKAKVILVFDNITLTSKNAAAVNIIQAEKVIINLPENSESTIKDDGEYTEFTDEDEPNATIFSNKWKRKINCKCFL